MGKSTARFTQTCFGRVSKGGELERSLSLLVILEFGVSNWDTLVEYVPFYFDEHNEILTTLLVEPHEGHHVKESRKFPVVCHHSHVVAQTSIYKR